MKSLEERKKQRAEQRGLAEKGILPDEGRLTADSDSGGDQTNQQGGTADELDSLTIAQLKDWVSGKGGQVPNDVKSRDDVLAYAKNFRTFKENEAAQQNGGNGSWNQNQ